MSPSIEDPSDAIASQTQVTRRDDDDDDDDVVHLLE